MKGTGPVPGLIADPHPLSAVPANGSTRRDLLMRAAGIAAVAGLSVLPARASLPALAAPKDGFNWEAIRGEFSLRNGLVHLNCANLAPTWNVASSAMAAVADTILADPSFENRVQVEDGVEDARSAVAALLHSSPDEIALVRNASEANCTVVNGLDLGPGDEVILWDQNHESNDLAWAVAARRRGYKVVRIPTPENPAGPADLVQPFIKAFNKRTRVIAFSHVSNATGMAIPAQRLCAAARRAGILSLVDGAQTFGALKVDLPELGCDFYTASAHKWLCGPHESGVLYVRSSALDTLWPAIVTHGWEKASVSGARKFDCLGQRQDGRIVGLGAAAGQHLWIGPDIIEARIRFLARELRAKLVESGASLRFTTSELEELSSGIVTLNVENTDPLELMKHFYFGYGISTRVIEDKGACSIRLCPNIYTSPDDLDLVAAAMAAIGQNMARAR